MKAKFHLILIGLPILIGLTGCATKFSHLNSTDQEISKVINQFLEDLTIKKMQRTSKMAYGGSSLLGYLLEEEEGKEFEVDHLDQEMDWSTLAIKNARKRKKCFDKKKCYIILNPLFSKNKKKAILTCQANRKTGGAMSYFLYEKINGEWIQIRKIGTSDWMYCG